MDRVVFLEGAGVRLAVCSAAGVAREASARHGLKAGSAAALAQGLVGSLLVAATEKARVDVQLECGGALRGLLAAADEAGAVGGLVRVDDLAIAPAARPSRLFPQPLLAPPHHGQARLSCLRRARVIRALRTLGAAELRDMAENDGGASLSCDFCAAKCQVTAQDLLRLAAGS